MKHEIISGGQTGADHAALDVAIRHDFPHHGWCSRGRLAEDGVIGGQYNLRETPAPDYLQRTEWNVRYSDETVILTLSASIPCTGVRSMLAAKFVGSKCGELI